VLLLNVFSTFSQLVEVHVGLAAGEKVGWVRDLLPAAQVSSHALGRVGLGRAWTCRLVWPGRTSATPAPRIELAGGHGSLDQPPDLARRAAHRLM
jgi:hypothetical protein